MLHGEEMVPERWPEGRLEQGARWEWDEEPRKMGCAWDMEWRLGEEIGTNTGYRCQGKKGLGL